jgi:hypothetical protein
MSALTFTSDALALPPGAFARTARHWLRRAGVPVFAHTQGPFRPYLFPLCSPTGYLVVSERPADHPHHNGVWIGADHVHRLTPVGAGRTEEYTYNFYVDEVFQGRAPGCQIVEAMTAADLPDGGFALDQRIVWRGPVEWGAPDGRVVLRERRRIVLRPASPGRHVIDVSSRLQAPAAAVRLGPTRHAYFNVRVAETMIGANGGRIADAFGRTGADAGADGVPWVDVTGPVGGGALAGIAVIAQPRPGLTPTWFVADWGVVSVGHFRRDGLTLDVGRTFATAFTLVVHDGRIDPADLDRVAATPPEPPEDTDP